MLELDLLTVLGGAGVLVSGVWGGFVYINGRFEKKADKESVNQEFGEIRGELATQRQTLGKVFDQIRDSETKHEARHRELLMHLLEGREPSQ